MKISLQIIIIKKIMLRSGYCKNKLNWVIKGSLTRSKNMRKQMLKNESWQKWFKMKDVFNHQ